MTNPPAESSTPATAARQVLRAADRAVLATIRAEDGWPYGSLVLVALDHDATPLLLISTLAEHTRNIGREPRVSLLFDGTGGHAQPLEGPRVTVLGRAGRSDATGDRVRFLARHPDAALYADFDDFAVYRVAVERAHLVAGFGRIHWIDKTDLLFDTGPYAALAAAEADIVAHMNEDHGEALDAYANRLLGQPGEGWSMTGIDPEGIDLRRGGAVARVLFERPLGDAEAARAALVRLANRARQGGR